MNTFYLHIGLHKTATTSLQADIFPEIPGVRYIGRYYRNPLYGEPLYDQIVKYTFSRRQPHKNEQERLRHEISYRLNKESIFLSEEWLTSDYDLIFGGRSCKWQEKLYRLSVLLKGFPVKILISTRNNEEALYSMYCEMYQSGQTKPIDGLLHFVLVDNNALAFRTRYLDNLVWTLFRVQPFFIDANELRYETYLDKLSNFFDCTVSAKIEKRNVKMRKEHGTYITSETFVYKLLRYFWLKLPRKVRSIVGQKAFSNLRAAIRTKCSRNEVISKPSDQEFNLIKDFLRND